MKPPYWLSRTLVAIVGVLLGVFVSTPSAWDEAQHMVLESYDAIRDTTGQNTKGTIGHTIQVADAALTGPARIIDGDTLEVRGIRVRLHGIDAPESAQRCRSASRIWSCGREATRALSRRIGSHPVACKQRDRDRYGRVVAVCRVGGEDVNAWMVAEGWAFAYRKYSRRYLAQEKAARAAKRGVWRGQVVAPWDWRRGQRLTDTGTAMKQGGGACKIKGNISKGGARIYHLPGGQFYDRTRIDTSRGERWFCSEGEARAAGWRRSRR